MDEDPIELQPARADRGPFGEERQTSASMNVPSSTAALSEAWATVCLMTRYACMGIDEAEDQTSHEGHENRQPEHRVEQTPETAARCHQHDELAVLLQLCRR